MTAMRFLLLLPLVLLAACTRPGSPPDGELPLPGTTVTVAGTVTSVDLEPMAYDGDAVIELATHDGPVTVRVPARTNLCEATGLGAVGDVLVGDHVEARGELGDDGSVVPCTDRNHSLVRDGSSKRAVYRGMYETGFETSAFSPCDRLDETWWVGGVDDSFQEQHDAIRAQHAAAEGRDMRLYVEATVVGELTDEGEYGHMGAYSRRLTIVETRDMAFLAVNPDASVACR